MEIKVCGPGCASCAKAEKAVHEALAQAGVQATVSKITDFAEMARLGVLSTPAIIVDGVIKCVGKVPSQKELLAWLS
jgi:small redox-active disulfide protein 2